MNSGRKNENNVIASLARKIAPACVLCLALLGCREKPIINSITWDSKGFMINGHYALFLIGGIQYYRIPPGEWEDRLRKMKGAGITMAEVYISWAFHEPEEGQFDFTGPSHDLDRFLTLCDKLGIFVYIRPGPYITNETDGGGFPGWLMKATRKTPLQTEDGRVAVRQYDAGYLKYASRYLSRVDAIVKKHQFTTKPNGCVLFYALENEYDWFKLFKSFEGGPIPDVPGMFTALRDIVRGHGISVPLTDASGVPPGSPFFAGTGDVNGILITPNQYPGTAGVSGQGPYNMEAVTAQAMADLHSSSKYAGLYVNTPSFVSETDRFVTLLQRIIFGGMEGANLFNVVGYTAEGYQNGVDLFFSGNIFDAVNTPAIAYFGGQIDYRGPVSPRGVLRSTYYTMKRKMEFLNTFGEAIASCGSARKDGQVSVGNADIGTWNGSGRSRYWLETDDGTVFLSLLNQGHYDSSVTTTSSSPTDVTIGIKGVTVKDVSFPNYSPMTVPFEDIATTAGDETWNDMILPVSLPLGGGLPTLSYSSSEILTLRDFNRRRLLVLYGRAGTPGEVRIVGLSGKPAITYSNIVGFVADENDGHILTFHYIHSPDTFLVLQLPGGKILEILITTIERANTYWFFESGGRELMAADVDFLEGADEGQGRVTIRTQRKPDLSTMLILTPSSPKFVTDDTLPWTYAGFSYTPEAMALSYTASVSFSLPPPPAINSGRTFSEGLPSPSQAESSWTGNPISLEEVGINRGHAWYMTGFTAASSVTQAALHVDSGSDIVSIYLNGAYISTVLPTGLAVDLPLSAGLITAGANTLVFRVQVWGHAIFHIPQLPGTFNIPTLALDSKRGLMGRAWVSLAGITSNLTDWKALSQLEGERSGYFTPEYDTSGWQTVAQPVTPGTPLVLRDGQTLWYRTQFDSSSLPDPERIFAPVLIRLTGRNCMGTIWLNDHLIGRWLSNNDWLLKGVDTSIPGTAKQAVRDMWIGQEPDSLDKFYLPQSYIQDGTNTITIALEDTSNSVYEPSPDMGEVDSIEVVYNTDNWTDRFGGDVGSLLRSSIVLQSP